LFFNKLIRIDGLFCYLLLFCALITIPCPKLGSYQSVALVKNQLLWESAVATGQNQKNRKNNSLLTKTGKARLGPLNLTQLGVMLEKSSKPKEQAKIKRAMAKRPPAKAMPVQDAVTAAPTE
jgi:hypothetical protein